MDYKASDEPSSRVAHDEYDVLHYDISLSFNIPAHVLYGAVEILLEVDTPDLETVILDFYNPMIVDSVTVDGNLAAHSHISPFLNVPLGGPHQPGETVTIRCTYHGTPSFDLNPFRWTQQGSSPMILSYSEPYGAPAWWVCKDDPKDKASFGIHLTVPADLVAVSNGTLDSVVDHGFGTKTYNWSTDYPMSTYLFSIAVTDFESWTEVYTALDGETTMNIDYYAYPSDMADAQESWNRNREMMEYYASIFGEYPFLNEKYAIAEFQHPGAMEHQTCTSMGWGWIDGTHVNDYVVAHELSHSWVGDMITMTEWSDAWCKEGFATYCEALYFEHKYGEGYYRNYMLQMHPTIWAVYAIYDITPPLHSAIYYKGAWVLHMLRHVIGDPDFFQAIYDYTNDPDFRYGVADTQDLRGVFENASGIDLSWFFDQWVYQGGYPVYQANWSSGPSSDGSYETYLVIVQSQDSEPTFKMPIDVRIDTSFGQEDFVVWDSLDVQAFHLQTVGEPSSLFLDPDSWIIKDTVPAGRPDSAGEPRLVLYPSYPNPTPGRTRIDFDLPMAGSVELEIFDASGRSVSRVLPGALPAGLNRLEWNGEDSGGRPAPAGVYWYRLRYRGEETGDRVVLIR
jgi:aminopeptidase N